MTNLEMREFFASRDPGGLRQACGFSTAVIAAAIGTHESAVKKYETRRVVPCGPNGTRYARIVAAMERHLAVTWDEVAA